MNAAVDTTPSLSVILTYGLVILLYLVILRLLLNLLQGVSDKHRQRSVIDRGIHATMSHRHEGSMQAFDSYGIAVVITKGGIATLSMAAIIVLLSVKIGVPATFLIIISVILVTWAANKWVRSHEKGTLREARVIAQKAGSMGAVLALSVTLVILLVVLAVIK
jgi:hypothetical protein